MVFTQSDIIDFRCNNLLLLRRCSYINFQKRDTFNSLFLSFPLPFFLLFYASRFSPQLLVIFKPISLFHYEARKRGIKRKREGCIKVWNLVCQEINYTRRRKGFYKYQKGSLFPFLCRGKADCQKIAFVFYIQHFFQLEITTIQFIKIFKELELSSNGVR